MALKTSSTIFSLLLLLSCQNIADEEMWILKARLEATPQVFNPLLSASGADRQVEGLLYLPLYNFGGDKLELIPVLGEGGPETKITESGVEYNFQINKNARWSDGHPISSKDFVFTIKQLFNPHLPTPHFRSFLSFIESIKSTSDHSLTVYAQKPFHLAEELLGSIELFPAHIHDPNQVLRKYSIAKLRSIAQDSALFILANNFQKYGKMNATRLVTSGPYTLVEVSKDERLIFKKKEAYWGKESDSPWLQQGPDLIEFKVLPSAAAAAQAMNAGDLDVAHRVSEDQLSKTNLNFAFPDQMLYYAMYYNRLKPQLSSAELRRAVSMALDVDTYIDEFQPNIAQRVNGPISPLNQYYARDVKPISYQPEKAMQLLDELGWVDENGDGIREKIIGGKEVNLSLEVLFASSSETGREMLSFFRAQAKKVGVDLIPKGMEFRKMFSLINSREYDSCLFARSWPPIDYDPKTYWHTDAITEGSNIVNFGDSNSDAIIDSIRVTLSPKVRARLYKDFQKSLAEDVPSAFLYAPKQRLAYSKKLELKTSSSWPGYIIQDTQLKK